jgi:hypothetical protein
MLLINVWRVVNQMVQKKRDLLRAKDINFEPVIVVHYCRMMLISVRIYRIIISKAGRPEKLITKHLNDEFCIIVQHEKNKYLFSFLHVNRKRIEKSMFIFIKWRSNFKVKFYKHSFFMMYIYCAIIN